MPSARNGRSRSKQAQLQRMLGELGTVLPRVMHGTPRCPAQGWYARLPDGRNVFLGDHAVLAGMNIAKMLNSEEAHA